MNVIDTKFATANSKEMNIDRYVILSDIRKTQKRKLINMASAMDVFGGKRFLGLTPKGKRVFVSYSITKDLDINIKFTHDLDVLLKDGAKLAGQRFSFPLNGKIKHTDNFMVAEKKVPSGEVTIKTLQWLKRLKLLCDMKYVNAFDKKKCTRYFFNQVANAIYVGPNELDNVNNTHIMKAWKWPEHNPYFNIEQTWSYPDEL
tara:strand:- start:320 stop:925 length:606 start_codon:yes stop_codon:yes gene_type:complete